MRRIFNCINGSHNERPSLISPSGGGVFRWRFINIFHKFAIRRSLGARRAATARRPHDICIQMTDSILLNDPKNKTNSNSLYSYISPDPLASPLIVPAPSPATPRVPAIHPPPVGRSSPIPILSATYRLFDPLKFYYTL